MYTKNTERGNTCLQVSPTDSIGEENESTIITFKALIMTCCFLLL